MQMRFLILAVAIVFFGALSTIALLDVGYFGIITPHFKSWGAGQVLADLVIMCLLGCIWMLHDARKRGTSAWPFVILTLVAGSFGPLFYLLLRDVRSTSRTRASV